MRPRISITGSVRPSVRRSVGRSVRPSVGHTFVKNKINQHFRVKYVIIQSCHHEDSSLALWALSLYSSSISRRKNHIKYSLKRNHHRRHRRSATNFHNGGRNHHQPLAKRQKQFVAESVRSRNKFLHAVDVQDFDVKD